MLESLNIHSAYLIMPLLSVSYSPQCLIAEQMQLTRAPHGRQQQGVPFDKLVLVYFLPREPSLVSQVSVVFGFAIQQTGKGKGILYCLFPKQEGVLVFFFSECAMKFLIKII